MRDRVEAAGVHDPGAGRAAAVVVRDVHPVDELRLAGEVDVVGAGLGAGGHQRLAVSEVGADGGDHDARAVGDVARARRRRSTSACEQRQVGRARRRRSARWSRTASSLAGLRPASAQRSPSGACRARYSAVSRPVNPVAPKRTMSSSRSDGGSERDTSVMRSIVPARGTLRPVRPSDGHDPRDRVAPDRRRRHRAARRDHRLRRRLPGLGRPARPRADVSTHRRRSGQRPVVRPPPTVVRRARARPGHGMGLADTGDARRGSAGGCGPRGRDRLPDEPIAGHADRQRHGHERAGGRCGRAGPGEDYRRPAGPDQRWHPQDRRRQWRRAAAAGRRPAGPDRRPAAAAGRATARL